tara:strand:+ start:1212 stop:2264 length:1053 start_codon:yes stop_codon:yes gene_type:complete
MAYTTIKKPTDYFNTVTFTGTGSSQQITTGLNMSANGGMVWNKLRDGANNNIVWDTIRTATESIYPDLTAAEATEATSLTAFTTTGWTGGGGGNTSNNGSTYVSWNWLAGSSHSGSSNSDGDVNSTVSVNTTAGFSIVKFNTNGQSGTFTVGHGLGAVPKMMILKPLPTTDAWWTYHTEIGNAKYLKLNTTDAEASNSDIWGSTTPTSSVFSLNTGFWGANTNDIIAYCFAEKTGYSKFGSYVANNSTDGNFVYLGFKPSFLMVKAYTGGSAGSRDWQLVDNKRLGYNVDNNCLFPNLANAEDTGDVVDLLSNGFKIRTATGTWNTSGESYIYIAFAEEPLVGDNPATAR